MTPSLFKSGFSLFSLLFLMLFGLLGAVPLQANDTLFVMRTGPCFGFCPVYDAVVFKSGAVHYIGKKFVKIPGERKFQLTNKEMRQLRRSIRTASLWQYPDQMPTQIADAPYVEMTVFDARGKKTVNGTIDRPEQLIQLEDRMKTLLENHGVPVREGVRE